MAKTKSAKFTFLEISPPRVVDNEEQEDKNIPVLLLTRFSSRPTVEFGTVSLGEEVIREIMVENPNQNPLTVTASKFPFKAGFGSVQNFTVEAKKKRELLINWKPTELGPCRHVADYQTKSGLRVQVIFIGNCIKNEKKKNSPKRKRPLPNKENFSPRKPSNPSSLFRAQDKAFPLPTTPIRRQTYKVVVPSPHAIRAKEKVDPYVKRSVAITPLVNKGIWGNKREMECEDRRFTFRANRRNLLEDSLEIPNLMAHDVMPISHDKQEMKCDERRFTFKANRRNLLEDSLEIPNVMAHDVTPISHDFFLESSKTVSPPEEIHYFTGRTTTIWPSHKTSQTKGLPLLQNLNADVLGTSRQTKVGFKPRVKDNIITSEDAYSAALREETGEHLFHASNGGSNNLVGSQLEMDSLLSQSAFDKPLQEPLYLGFPEESSMDSHRCSTGTKPKIVAGNAFTGSKKELTKDNNVNRCLFIDNSVKNGSVLQKWKPAPRNSTEKKVPSSDKFKYKSLYGQREN